jgi:hypothetical protein
MKCCGRFPLLKAKEKKIEKSPISYSWFWVCSHKYKSLIKFFVFHIWFINSFIRLISNFSISSYLGSPLGLDNFFHKCTRYLVRPYFTDEISPKSEISMSSTWAGFLLCTLYPWIHCVIVAASPLREPPTPPWAAFPNRIGFLSSHHSLLHTLFKLHENANF